MSAAKRIAVLVRISGRVQGVGFRWWTMHEAAGRGLDGWVRNRRDGTVEALVAGEEQRVEEMIGTLRRGPPVGRVDDLRIAPTSDPGPTGFSQESTL